jgi:DUF4097 and DUF4098 domain-containing protein YvlB
MTARHVVPLLVLLVGSPLAAQSEKSLGCENGSRGGRQQRHCEMREFPVAAASRISVDGRTNGGISVKGADRNDMLVRARVDAWAPTEAEARAIATQISIQTSGQIRADAPDFGDGRGWAVSYEIFVPRRTDLSLKAHNGGIAIADVRGEVQFDVHNGGVSLKRMGGSVHGKTVNGGVSVDLDGPRWEGSELDVAATNGGVSLSVPENFSARLEARTVNGRVSVDFPGAVQGNGNGREISMTVGGGGPLVRAVTTNGGVSIRRKT